MLESGWLQICNASFAKRALAMWISSWHVKQFSLDIRCSLAVELCGLVLIAIQWTYHIWICRTWQQDLEYKFILIISIRSDVLQFYVVYIYLGWWVIVRILWMSMTAWVMLLLLKKIKNIAPIPTISIFCIS